MILFLNRNKTFYEALSRWSYENIDLFGLLAIGIRILNYYKNIQMYHAIRSCQAQFFISMVRYNLSIHPVVLKKISTFLKETLVKTKKQKTFIFYNYYKYNIFWYFSCMKNIT
jgi:hypothetical protein